MWPVTFYELDPEVAGGWGAGTLADRSVYPPVVMQLTYEFSGWLGDDLVTSFPVYIVTERLRNALASSRLTGFAFDAVTVTTNEEFEEVGAPELPSWSWLRLTGHPYVDDAAAGHLGQLTVSEGLLALLREFQVDHCDVEPLRW
jgi:hypothetical protein